MQDPQPIAYLYLTGAHIPEPAMMSPKLYLYLMRCNVIMNDLPLLPPQLPPSVGLAPVPEPVKPLKAGSPIFWNASDSYPDSSYKYKYLNWLLRASICV
jgi:hypothetical protein